MESLVPSGGASVQAVGLRYGLLAGLVNMLLTFGLNVLHMPENQVVFGLRLILLVTGVVLAQREYRQRHAGFMGYGQALGIGLLVSLVMGVLSALFFYGYTTFIDPGIIDQMMEKARTDAAAYGTSEEQLDEAMELVARYKTPALLAGASLLRFVLGGTVISLLSAAFTKNAQPDFE